MQLRTKETCFLYCKDVNFILMTVQKRLGESETIHPLLSNYSSKNGGKGGRRLFEEGGLVLNFG